MKASTAKQMVYSSNTNCAAGCVRLSSEKAAGVHWATCDSQRANPIHPTTGRSNHEDTCPRLHLCNLQYLQCFGIWRVNTYVVLPERGTASVGDLSTFSVWQCNILGSPNRLRFWACQRHPSSPSYSMNAGCIFSSTQTWQWKTWDGYMLPMMRCGLERLMSKKDLLRWGWCSVLPP